MPYLVRVGRIDTNKSGTGARGYVIKRSGKRVTVWCGPIDVIGGKFYWRTRKAVAIWDEEHSTVEDAKADVARTLREQLSPASRSGGYHPLPTGRRILW